MQRKCPAEMSWLTDDELSMWHMTNKDEGLGRRILMWKDISDLRHKGQIIKQNNDVGWLWQKTALVKHVLGKSREHAQGGSFPHGRAVCGGVGL